MPPISRYWLFQLSGWLCFALLNLYIALLTKECNQEVLVINLLIAVFGIGTTHAFRYHILKHELASRPTEKLIPYVALCLLLMSIAFNVIYYLSLSVFYPQAFLPMKGSDLIGTFISVYFLFSLWSIIYFAWTYVEDNRRLLIERLRMESDMKDMEIRTIRSHLQPHFIFNALNSIRALIDENPAQARKAITQISNILRNSITRQEITDTLENELRLTNDYLALEKIRFEDRLQYKQNIDPASLTVQIPSMMLQTLVENGIKHGISRAEQGGEISVQTHVDEGGVWIEIANTGTLDHDTPREDSLSFGLRSTRERLQHIYGQKAKFSIRQDGDYVRVLIHIQPEKSESL
jgi:LytS/YehU family sensor histidine kinase